MQLGKTSVTLLFNAPTQYMIPVFQRDYVWKLDKQGASFDTDGNGFSQRIWLE